MDKLVSVIMPVYNSERYLEDSIKSILNQTYKNFELIIINDGSSDSSEKIILSFRDKRIKYLKNKINQGLSSSLNTGLKVTTGEYIARMDSDDISHYDRLRKQVYFLEKNPDYGVVGSKYIILNEARIPHELGGMDFWTNEEIKLSLFSNNVFVHGETIYRSVLIKKNNLEYNSRYNPCEDYYLWIQMSDKTKFFIIDEPLYSYMINPLSMSGTRWIEMKEMIKKIAKEHQQIKGLPYLDNKMLLLFFSSGIKKKDGYVLYNKQKIYRNHQLNYQEFLFRTALIYLKHLNYQGFFLLGLSFFINPFNWVRKFYRIIFIKQPRLKKMAKQI